MKVNFACFTPKSWDRRSREDLVECVTHCHDDQVEGYTSNYPVHLTVLAAKSEMMTALCHSTCDFFLCIVLDKLYFRNFW